MGHPEGDWAIESDWDTPIASDWKHAVRQLYRGDLVGVRQHLDHLDSLGVNLATSPRCSRPGRAIATTPRHSTRLIRCSAAMPPSRRWSTPPTGAASGSSATSPPTIRATTIAGSRRRWPTTSAPESGYYYFTEHPHDYVGWFDVPTLPKFDLRSAPLREALVGSDGVAARWLRGSSTNGTDGTRRLAHRRRQHDRSSRRNRRQPRRVPRPAGDDGDRAPGHLAGRRAPPRRHRRSRRRRLARGDGVHVVHAASVELVGEAIGSADRCPWPASLRRR